MAKRLKKILTVSLAVCMVAFLTACGEKEIDPFKDIKITYTGYSPYIKVSTDSTQCDSIVSECIEFKTEEKSLRNGDEFTVTAVYNQSTLKEKGFTVTSDRKKYVIENQPEYINSVGGLNLQELQSEIDDKLTTVTAANEDSSDFAGIYLGGANFDSVKSKTLKATYLTFLKKQFEDKYGTNYGDKKNYNRYMQIYEYVVNRRDWWNGGEYKDPIKVYVIVYADNLNKDANGKLNWTLELGSKVYDSYYDLINECVTTEEQYYNITKIK